MGIRCIPVYTHDYTSATTTITYTFHSRNQEAIPDMKYSSSLNRPAVHQSSSVIQILDSSERPADADEFWIWMRGREMMCCDINLLCAGIRSFTQLNNECVFQYWALHIANTTECVLFTMNTVFTHMNCYLVLVGRYVYRHTEAG